MARDLRRAGESAVMKVGRGEIGIQQGRRLEQTAGADVMLPVIDECAGGYMACRTAQRRIVRKWLVEQHLAVLFRLAQGPREFACGAKPPVRHEIDVFYISDHRVEDFRRRLSARKFIDDDVAHEVGQRQCSSVVAVGCEQMRAAQARYGQRIENAVVGLWIEQVSGRIEGPGLRRQAGNIQSRIRGAVDVTSVAADSRLPSGAAESQRRTECHIAEGHQVGLAAAAAFRAEDFAGLIEGLLAQFRAGRKQARISAKFGDGRSRECRGHRKYREYSAKRLAFPNHDQFFTQFPRPGLSRPDSRPTIARSLTSDSLTSRRRTWSRVCSVGTATSACINDRSLEKTFASSALRLLVAGANTRSYAAAIEATLSRISASELPLKGDSPPSALFSPISYISLAVPFSSPWGVRVVVRNWRSNSVRLAMSSSVAGSACTSCAPKSLASIAWNPFSASGQASILRSRSGKYSLVITSEPSQPERAASHDCCAPARSPAAMRSRIFLTESRLRPIR